MEGMGSREGDGRRWEDRRRRVFRGGEMKGIGSRRWEEG